MKGANASVAIDLTARGEPTITELSKSCPIVWAILGFWMPCWPKELLKELLRMLMLNVWVIAI